MHIAARTARDVDRVVCFLHARHARPVARRGELLDPLDHPALLAHEHGALAGVLTYLPGIVDCEILTLHVADQWLGVGTALVTELVRRAHPGWTELRVIIITTNDNLDALRFYQRRGFELVELRAAAVDTTRADLKPSIPTRGYYDLPTGSAPLGSRDRIRA
ncbi:MAG TPA: GNAT family N-acetyltransferase [Pseudonocardiaceae bacterium]|nr:GNAT family N-acetyltransferase [Pseudonocardiaceae bacterium]